MMVGSNTFEVVDKTFILVKLMLARLGWLDGRATHNLNETETIHLRKVCLVAFNAKQSIEWRRELNVECGDKFSDKQITAHRLLTLLKFNFISDAEMRMEREVRGVN